MLKISVYIGTQPLYTYQAAKPPVVGSIVGGFVVDKVTSDAKTATVSVKQNFAAKHRS